MKKKLWALVLSLILALSLCVGLVACGGGKGGKGDPDPITITLDKTTLPLTVDGANGTIVATVTGSTKTVTWSVSPAGKVNLTVSNSNGNIVTVSPVAEGTATITASLEGATSKTCAVTVSAGGGPGPGPEPVTYTMQESTAANALNTTNNGKWCYWAAIPAYDQSIHVTSVSAEYDDGTVTATYASQSPSSATPCDWGMQLLYNNPEAATYEYWTVSFNLTSNIATKITYLGDDINFTPGTPALVTKSFVQQDNDPSINLQIQVSGGHENTITISDVQFVKTTQTPLAAPTFTLSGNDNVVTITDVDHAGSYQAGLFANANDAAPAHILTDVATGSPLDTEGIPMGTYTVKLRTLPEDFSTYGVSPWSTDSAEITLADTGTPIACGNSCAEGNAIDAAGTWMVYSNDNAGDSAMLFSSSVPNSLGTIVLNHTAPGTFPWSTQIFYELPDVTDGASYTLSFTVTSTVAATIKVNDEHKTLVANTPTQITVTRNEPANVQGQYGKVGASILIMLGQDSAAAAPAGTYTFADIVFGPAA